MRKSILAFGAVITLGGVVHAVPVMEAEERAANVSAADLRAALSARLLYMPGDTGRIVVDGCSLERVLGVEVRLEFQRRATGGSLPIPGSVQFSDCDTPRPADGVLWKLSGAMEWSGGRTILLAVDVEKKGGREFHRERYTIHDGRVSELALSAWGVFD